MSSLHEQTQSHLGLAVELLVGWVVVALLAAMIVGFSTAIIPVDGLPPIPIVAPDLSRDADDDLDPRDPLVVCTVYLDHTRCAREPT